MQGCNLTLQQPRLPHTRTAELVPHRQYLACIQFPYLRQLAKLAWFMGAKFRQSSIGPCSEKAKSAGNPAYRGRSWRWFADAVLPLNDVSFRINSINVR